MKRRSIYIPIGLLKPFSRKSDPGQGLREEKALNRQSVRIYGT